MQYFLQLIRPTLESFLSRIFLTAELLDLRPFFVVAFIDCAPSLRMRLQPSRGEGRLPTERRLPIVSVRVPPLRDLFDRVGLVDLARRKSCR